MWPVGDILRTRFSEALYIRVPQAGQSLKSADKKEMTVTPSVCVVHARHDRGRSLRLPLVKSKTPAATKIRSFFIQKDFVFDSNF